MRKCDIVMVSWNQLEYAKLCIKSIMDYTDVESRLIIVDNGSDADTTGYLKALRPNRLVEIKLILNKENLGAIKARNIGLREFEAEYLCLIDNDIEVTPRWLSKMIRLLESDPKIGIINPSSNNFGQIPPSGIGLNEYAKSLERFRGEYIEIGTGISFCMLVRGEVVKKIGYLDEDLEIMLYEDTDYAMRANKEGYRCVIQKDVYVWHHGHKTSSRLKKYNEIAAKNRDTFYKKWGRPLRIAWFAAAYLKSELMKGILTECIEVARDGNFVYLFVQANDVCPPEEIFKRNSLIEHANVHIILYHGRNFKWFCLWRALKKRKKKYDLVITDEERTASLIKRFRPLYKAEVLSAVDFGEITKAARSLKFR